MKLNQNEERLSVAAAKSGMPENTARKYMRLGKLPSQCKQIRNWRMREDPLSRFATLPSPSPVSPSFPPQYGVDHLTLTHKVKLPIFFIEKASSYYITPHGKSRLLMWYAGRYAVARRKKGWPVKREMAQFQAIG